MKTNTLSPELLCRTDAYREGTYSEIYPDIGQDMPEIRNWKWSNPN
jgi:hypothetical protein